MGLVLSKPQQLLQRFRKGQLQWQARGPLGRRLGRRTGMHGRVGRGGAERSVGWQGAGGAKEAEGSEVVGKV